MDLSTLRVAGLVVVFGLVSLAAQDGPRTNGANLPVRTDANSYVIAVEQTYTGPDGPRRPFANTLVRTDSNGYLIITNPTGFGGTIDISGTPVNDQIAIWTDADTLEGDSDFLWDGANTLTIGVDGVSLTDDNDGALTFLGLGDGSDEDLTLNLDDTANTVTWSSSTGVTTWSMTGIDVSMPVNTQIFLDDGDVTNPGLSFRSDGDMGIIRGANNRMTIQATNEIRLEASVVLLRVNGVILRLKNDLATIELGVSEDVVLAWDAADVFARRRSTNAQEDRLYNTDSGSDDEFLSVGFINNANIATFETEATGSGTVRDFLFAGGNVGLDVPKITAGSGTGVTVNATGFVVGLTYKVTITQDHWIAAALTQDLTIATLPAKTRITGVIADITQQFACTATCTSSTLSMVLGVGSGGAEYLDSFDVDAATAQFGLVDAERGTSLQGVVNGETPSWSGTTTLVARLTSGTGNLGDGATTNLSGGDVVFYVETAVQP